MLSDVDILGKEFMKQKTNLWKAAKQAAELFYPSRCPLCGQIPQTADPHGDVCDMCRAKLVYTGENYCMKCGRPILSERDEYCRDCQRHSRSFARCRAVFSYQGAVRTSLYRFKYANKREYAGYYGREMWQYLGDWIQSLHADVIVPVPIHKKRYRQRGYNQAALLAKELSRLSGIPADTKTLVRIRNTMPQKQLTALERTANLKGAFAVRSPELKGKRILLTDDIYTTGSTLDAAAQTLTKAGAQTVYAVCVAVGG